MNRGQVAAKVRENKERHPERYCSAKGCLWSRTSGKSCPKHPYAAISLGRVTIPASNPFLPEDLQ